jgi:23S rRNA (cytidine1920-2'-O)/16S rRNA (cytidine1409-2'-O)-methyltransferase
VRRGLAQNRQEAQEAVGAGRVLVAGSVADKASRLVGAGEALVLRGPRPKFVSRGGLKLEAALTRFDLDVAGLTTLDAGASTGGFTDCLLRRGAARVTAVDVGYGQLDQRLRQDPRVLVLERTNIRHLTPEALTSYPRPGPWSPVDLLTADLSFISLTLVAPVLAGPLLHPGGTLVLLVKPQFEAGRAEAARGKGVVRDPGIWRRTLGEVASALDGAGAAIMGAMASPVAGPAGNIEFLLWARAGAAPTGAALDQALDDAVAEALAMNRD